MHGSDGNALCCDSSDEAIHSRLSAEGPVYQCAMQRAPSRETLVSLPRLSAWLHVTGRLVRSAIAQAAGWSGELGLVAQR